MPCASSPPIEPFAQWSASFAPTGPLPRLCKRNGSQMLKPVTASFVEASPKWAIRAKPADPCIDGIFRPAQVSDSRWIVDCTASYLIPGVSAHETRVDESSSQHSQCALQVDSRRFRTSPCLLHSSLLRDPFSYSDSAVCARFRPLASHGNPWQHSRILHHCDTQIQCRSDDHKRGHHRVF